MIYFSLILHQKSQDFFFLRAQKEAERFRNVLKPEESAAERDGKKNKKKKEDES